jgi:hypothetical protein
MGVPSGRIVQVGVDWLTCSATRRASARRLTAIGRRILSAEERRGNIRKLWHFSGYDGLHCGGVQVGERYDGACVRLTSGLADDHWLAAYQEADNLSRIDLQVTVRYGRDPRQIISQHYREALCFTKRHPRGATVDLWKSSNGSSTLYLGQRCSDNFGRIYDKGRESKVDTLRNCVRYERECKGDVAKAMGHLLARSRNRKPQIVAEVSSFITARGVSQGFALSPMTSIEVPAKISDHDRLLSWLTVQVSPSVKQLIAAGRYNEVLIALGLTGSTQSRLQLVKKAG